MYRRFFLKKLLTVLKEYVCDVESENQIFLLLSLYLGLLEVMYWEALEGEREQDGSKADETEMKKFFSSQNVCVQFNILQMFVAVVAHTHNHF